MSIPIMSPLRAAHPEHRPRPVTWVARCPHGRDTEWTAVQVDTAARIACGCTCPEEAA